MTSTTSAALVPVYSTAESSNQLISVNMTGITKLTPTNYLTWKLQVSALLEAHELHGFIDDTDRTPAATITTNGTTQPNPKHAPWKRQDKMLYSSLIGSLSLPVQPLVARATTTRDVWLTLARIYGQPSRGHIKQIKQQLKKTLKGTQSVADYMRNVISKSDQLALLGSPLDHEDLLDIIVDGLGEEYRSVVDMVNGRDVPITIEELHEKLLNKENSLISQEANLPAFLPATANVATYRPPSQYQAPTSPYQASHQFQQHSPSQNRGGYRGGYRGGRGTGYQGKCQICGVHGHSARRCAQLQYMQPQYQQSTYTRPPSSNYSPQQQPHQPSQWNPQAHYTTSSPHPPPDGSWLLDSGASHHIASDLANLSMHSPYHGTDTVTVGNGAGLPITHTGSAHLPSHSQPLTLLDVLCVPSIKKNLISINKLCKTNNVMVQLCPYDFQVKDLKSGTTLISGPASNGVYEWTPKPSSLSSVSVFSMYQVFFCQLARKAWSSLSSYS